MRQSAKLALEVAADAALEGRDLCPAQFDALTAAAPLVDTPVSVLDARVTDGAMCAGGDPEAWYPPYGTARVSTDRKVERSRADELCESCPVRAECLALSLDLGELGKWGVWGGLSERDRADLRPLWQELGCRVAEAKLAAATPAGLEAVA